MKGLLVAIGVAACLAATAGTAVAQPSPARSPAWRPWHPVISLGGGWVGADALGSVTAGSRAAGLGTLTPPAFTLFQTESTLDGAPRADAAIAVPVTQTLAVEIAGSIARPTLTTSISRDAEGAPATSASERIDEYTVGARVLYDLPRWTFGRRFRPFVAAGGAYLRQLHDEQVLVETGQVWSAGAGLRVWLRGPGPRRGPSIGLTAETGWSWRTGGIAFTDGARGVPTASVRAFVGL